MGKEKNRGGRPIKLSDQVTEAIIEGIQHGLTLKAASKAAGISYSTLASWVTRGKLSKKNGVEDEFKALVERISCATSAAWLAHRKRFFFNLRPRDFRYGWKNPMPRKTREKISNFWQQIKQRRRRQEWGW